MFTCKMTIFRNLLLRETVHHEVNACALLDGAIRVKYIRNLLDVINIYLKLPP